MKILLERRKGNLYLSGQYGRTPLLYAAEYGSEGVVNILLERGNFNPDSSDQNGQTAL